MKDVLINLITKEKLLEEEEEVVKVGEQIVNV